MKPAAPLLLMLCLNSPWAAYQAEAAQLSYRLLVLGIPVADASLNIELTPVSYRVALAFHTTGVVGFVDPSRLQQTVSGSLEDDRPAPQYYTSVGYLHGQDRVVEMTWHDGTPVVTSITPANSTEREDVPPTLLPGAVDPESLIALLLRVVEQTGRCEGSGRGYDGRDLQAFQSWTTGTETIKAAEGSSYSGPALRCEFLSRTLAGFRFGSGGEQDRRPRRGTVWLAQVLPGMPRLPVRAAVETRWFGEATIDLTSAQP